MEKSILFFDIDGTILSEETFMIPESVEKAFEAVKKKGNMIFINTGRTKCTIPDEIKALPIDGILCGCGIYLTYNNSVLFEQHLQDSQRKAFLDKMIECKVDGVLEGVNDVYFKSKNTGNRIMENMRNYVVKMGMGKTKFYDKEMCDFDKMYIFKGEESNLDEFFRYIDREMDVIVRENDTYECVIKGYSKATAIQQILDEFHVDKKDAYVFGDSANDMSMFEFVDHSIAMGKHDSVLDPYTEYVTKTVEEDGIWHAIEHYGLM